jgi:NarL family two-component system sensor histidine kinase LiaS
MVLKNILPEHIHERLINIDDLSLKEVSLQTKIELLQIIKEAITNIIKHSKANEIELLLYGETDKIILKIKDNGKGFNLNDAGNGLGLKSMNDRVAKMNGEIIFISARDKGTEINITLPSE